MSKHYNDNDDTKLGNYLMISRLVIILAVLVQVFALYLTDILKVYGVVKLSDSSSILSFLATVISYTKVNVALNSLNVISYAVATVLNVWLATEVNLTLKRFGGINMFSIFGKGKKSKNEEDDYDTITIHNRQDSDGGKQSNSATIDLTNEYNGSNDDGTNKGSNSKQGDNDGTLRSRVVRKSNKVYTPFTGLGTMSNGKRKSKVCPRTSNGSPINVTVDIVQKNVSNDNVKSFLVDNWIKIEYFDTKRLKSIDLLFPNTIRNALIDCLSLDGYKDFADSLTEEDGTKRSELYLGELKPFSGYGAISFRNSSRVAHLYILALRLPNYKSDETSSENYVMNERNSKDIQSRRTNGGYNYKPNYFGYYYYLISDVKLGESMFCKRYLNLNHLSSTINKTTLSISLDGSVEVKLNCTDNRHRVSCPTCNKSFDDGIVALPGWRYANRYIGYDSTHAKNDERSYKLSLSYYFSGVDVPEYATRRLVFGTGGYKTSNDGKLVSKPYKAFNKLEQFKTLYPADNSILSVMDRDGELDEATTKRISDGYKLRYNLHTDTISFTDESVDNSNKNNIFPIGRVCPNCYFELPTDLFSDNINSYTRIMLFGAPGSGKTIFWHTAVRLMLYIENQLESINKDNRQEVTDRLIESFGEYPEHQWFKLSSSVLGMSKYFEDEAKISLATNRLPKSTVATNVYPPFFLKSKLTYQKQLITQSSLNDTQYTKGLLGFIDTPGEFIYSREFGGKNSNYNKIGNDKKLDQTRINMSINSNVLLFFLDPVENKQDQERGPQFERIIDMVHTLDTTLENKHIFLVVNKCDLWLNLNSEENTIQNAICNAVYIPIEEKKNIKDYIVQELTNLKQVTNQCLDVIKSLADLESNGVSDAELGYVNEYLSYIEEYKNDPTIQNDIDVSKSSNFFTNVLKLYNSIQNFIALTFANSPVHPYVHIIFTSPMGSFIGKSLDVPSPDKSLYFSELLRYLSVIDASLSLNLDMSSTTDVSVSTVKENPYLYKLSMLTNSVREQILKHKELFTAEQLEAIGLSNVESAKSVDYSESINTQEE